ncbi:MAG: hypothetical protein AMJ46_08555 [Latescibacteria bacterium DG_63]|nr:MAG: hypothetical protein AMJ46_08555 [Latescibacteria bacterium DG_63]
MVSTRASKGKRLRRGRNRALLDEKRLRSIKKRIAEGYYNSKEVRRTIAERISDRVLENNEGEETER